MIFFKCTPKCDSEDKQERRSMLYGALFACQVDKGSITQDI